MDDIQPSVKSEPVFRDPEGPAGGYGYAYNAVLSGANEPKAVTTTPMVYDSVNPIRKASDQVTSLPLPGQHGRGQNRGNNVVDTAGRARWVPAQGKR